MDDFPSIAPFAPIFMFGAIIVIVAIIGIVSSVRDKKRREQLFLFAQSVGLQMVDPFAFSGPPQTGFFSIFNTSSDMLSTGILARFQGFQPFGVGHGMSVKNLLVGTRNGVDWYMFDYYYTTGSGKSQQRHHYAIMAGRVPFAFPQLTLKPEDVFTRLGQHLGMHELKFELDEFNRRYFITCNNEKMAYDILCPQTIEYLMRLPIRWWQFFGPQIMVAQIGDLRPEVALQVMQEVTDFTAMLPNYVKQDLGFQPTWANAFQ